MPQCYPQPLAPSFFFLSLCTFPSEGGVESVLVITWESDQATSGRWHPVRCLTGGIPIPTPRGGLSEYETFRGIGWELRLGVQVTNSEQVLGLDGHSLTDCIRVEVALGAGGASWSWLVSRAATLYLPT